MVVEGLIWSFCLAFGRTLPSVGIERFMLALVAVAVMHLIRRFGPRHVFAPQRARRFSCRKSAKACSGVATCRRLG